MVFKFKNIFILATTSFLLGWLILIIANPITSSMVMYYEKLNLSMLEILII